jgi:hypothetical protein
MAEVPGPGPVDTTGMVGKRGKKDANTTIRVASAVVGWVASARRA